MDVIYGVERAITELLLWILLMTVSVIFHNKMVDDDHEDEYWWQVADLILMRFYIERMTYMNPNTIYELLTSLTPSKSDIDKKFKIFSAMSEIYKGFNEHGTNFDEWDTVKQGGYRNKPKALRDLLQAFSSLGLHNAYSKSNVEGVKYAKKWFDSRVNIAKAFYHESKNKSNKNNKSNDPYNYNYNYNYDYNYNY